MAANTVSMSAAHHLTSARVAPSFACSEERHVPRGRTHCNDLRSEHRSSGRHKPATGSQPSPGPQLRTVCVSLATSHSRRRTKLHTRVVGSPSGTPIKVACSVLNTVGGPQGGSFMERASEATNSLSVCSDRRREALPPLRAAVVWDPRPTRVV